MSTTITKKAFTNMLKVWSADYSQKDLTTQCRIEAVRESIIGTPNYDNGIHRASVMLNHDLMTA